MTSGKDSEKKLVAASLAVPRVSQTLDRLTALFSLWLIGGLFLDGWAHRNLGDLETFFTPWHAVLYSGYAALAGSLSLFAARNRVRNGAGVKLLPPGYEFALPGAALFAVGAVGDMLWHIAFGIEVDVEALLSPTHLILALGGWMMITAPARSARYQTSQGSLAGWKTSLPSILAVALALSLVAFFTQFANPVAESWIFGSAVPGVSSGIAQEFGIASLILASMTLLGFVLFARSFRWPFGALTVVLELNALGMSVLASDFSTMPAGVLAGVAADIVVKRAAGGQSFVHVAALGAIVPATYVAVLLLVHAIIGDLSWTIHLWAGSIVLVAMLGALFAMAAHSRTPAVSTES